MGNALAVVPAPPRGRLRRNAKAFSVASLRGKTVWPIAVAEFKGGEKIRMTCSMMAGHPWDFARARRLLAQTIGNERGSGAAYAAATIDLDRKIAAASAIAKDPGVNYEEAGNALLGMERLRQRRRKAIEQAQTDVLHAFSAKHGRVYPPATDFASFHLELDGERIEPTLVLPKETRARLPKPKPPSEKGNVMGKHFNVAVHSKLDDVESESVELVHASTSTIALKLARRAFYRTSPDRAVISSAEIIWPVDVSPLTEEEIANAPIGPSVASNVVDIRSAHKPEPIAPEIAPVARFEGTMVIKGLDDLKRAVATPGLVISVVAHWKPQEVGTTRTKMKTAVPSNPASLRFNEDGTVTFYPTRARSWTLGFGATA